MPNEPVHPAKRYVNLFLLEMLQGAPGVRVARRSAPLPVLQDHAPPDFDRCRNRLKVLAGLDPVAYPSPRDGTVDVGIDRQVDGQWYECVYTVSLRFTD